MKLPTIHGYIDRRILVNFTADPAHVRTILPDCFRPKLYEGKAIVGICLIRLKHVKPKGMPDFLGVNSENGAHRIAVEWEDKGRLREGVYVPRRDTSLRLNSLAGGRIFPGKHYLAKFNVQEGDGRYHVDFTSSDNTSILVDVRESREFSPHSIFGSLQNASDFLEKGSTGFSPNKDKYEGLRLDTHHWEVHPLEAISIKSSFYENEAIFPKGSVQFDNALLMTQVEHEWKTLSSMG